MHNELATNTRSEVEKISAETDTTIIAASLRSPRSLYYNYNVGEGSDLIFGVSLSDYATARESHNNIPSILRLCIDEVDKRGLEVEGIYRVSSSTQLVLQSLIPDCSCPSRPM